jgi:uncharacterized protein (DUF779 family)
MIERVTATDATLELIELLKSKHGPVMFHQSGGCCDGSAPMCYPDGDLMVGDQDVLLGSIGDSPFYMHKSQYDYWKHTQLIIDGRWSRRYVFIRGCRRQTILNQITCLHG